MGITRDLSSSRDPQAPATAGVRLAMVCQCDASGRMVRILTPVDSVFGYAIEQLEGLPLAELLAPGPGRDSLASYLEYLTQEQPAPEPYPAHGLAANGQVIGIEVHWQYVLDQDDNVSGFLCTILDVTARRERDAAQRRTEDLLRSVVNSVGEALWVVDEDLRIILFSDVAREWCQGLGVDVSATDGARITDVFPFLGPTVLSEYATVFASGQAIRTSETTLVNGRPIATETRKIPVFGDGIVQRVVTIIEDVTDREDVLDYVMAQRDLAHDLLGSKTVDEALNAWIGVVGWVARVDAIGVYLEGAEPGCLSLAIQRGVPESLLEQVAQMPQGRYWRQLSERRTATYQFVSDIPDEVGGSLADAGYRTWAATPVRYGDELIAACGLAWHSDTLPSSELRGRLDVLVSQLGSALVRLRVMEQLRASEERLELTFDGPDLALWDLDVETDVAYPSLGLARMFGLTVEEMEADPHWWRRLERHPEDDRNFDPIWSKHMEGETPFDQHEFRVRWSGQEWRWMHMRGRIVEFMPDGSPKRILGLVQEITDHKIDEQRRGDLEIRNQKLESLGVMAGGIAHDFNNILQSVLSNATLAMEYISIASPARAALTNIRTAAIRAAELSDQMLAYSGRRKLMSEPVNLSALASEMATLLQASVSKKAVLYRELAEDLPLISGDPTQLRQVIMNLITNASDAIGDSGGDIWITTTWRMEPDAIHRVILSVRDSGCGMTERTRQQVFDPFFSTKQGGRGLGLASVLGIVQKHNGAILVDSVVGRGTTVTVELPAAPSDAWLSAGPVAVDPDPDGGGVGVGAGGLVMVVDDEHGIRESTRLLLEIRGYEVVTAEDGARAVELYGELGDRVGAVLMDLRMPRMGGEEALAAIRERSATVPVIAVSAIGGAAASDDLASMGFTGFLRKPIQIDELVRWLSEHMCPSSE